MIISVAIPVTKSRYVSKAIQNCLDQSFEDFELIIVNNAKNSDEKKRIRFIINNFKDERIRYYENEEQLNMIANWNRCLTLANGKFFSILCDDDKWNNEFLSDLHSLTVKYPSYSVFRCRSGIIDENDNLISITEGAPEVQGVLDFIYSRISGKNHFFLSDFLLKTSELKSLGGYVDVPSGWGSDDLTYYKIGIKNGIITSPAINFYYRNSPISVTNNNKLFSKIKALSIQKAEILKLISDYTIVDHSESILIKMILKKLVMFKIIRTVNLIKGQFLNYFKFKI